MKIKNVVTTTNIDLTTNVIRPRQQKPLYYPNWMKDNDAYIVKINKMKQKFGHNFLKEAPHIEIEFHQCYSARMCTKINFLNLKWIVQIYLNM